MGRINDKREAIGPNSRAIIFMIRKNIIEGTTQTKAIITMVFKNRFSLRIHISCARLSVEFCKAIFLDCFFNLSYVDQYITKDSSMPLTLKMENAI